MFALMSLLISLSQPLPLLWVPIQVLLWSNLLSLGKLNQLSLCLGLELSEGVFPMIPLSLHNIKPQQLLAPEWATQLLTSPFLPIMFE